MISRSRNHKYIESTYIYGSEEWTFIERDKVNLIKPTGDGSRIISKAQELHNLHHAKEISFTTSTESLAFGLDQSQL